MKVRILESARHDLRRDYSFYENQQQGVGDYFLDTLFSDIDSLAVYGGTHPRRFGFHWVLSSRFPFAIYYQVAEGCAVVRAVFWAAGVILDGSSVA